MNDRIDDVRRRIAALWTELAGHPDMDAARLLIHELAALKAELAYLERKEQELADAA